MTSIQESNKPRFAILGTSASIPTAVRDNTSIVFFTRSEGILIDCGSAPTRKLEQVGVPLNNLKHVILTHTHVDHIYGVPSLIHALWLNGRKDVLYFHCLDETRRVFEQLVDAFELREKSGMFPIEIASIPMEEYFPAINTDAFKIFTSPVRHNVPNIGIRIEEQITNNEISVVYSCDTEPCESLIRLAKGADTLIQECAFTSDVESHKWHTTGIEAGEIASESEVRNLLLVHVDPSAQTKIEQLISEAQLQFGGNVTVPEDMTVYSFIR